MMNEEALAAGLVVGFLIFYLVMLGIGLASYIMTAVSYYTIAERRQVKHPWMAWIPMLNYYLIGSIVDDFEERNGYKRKWRVALLTLAITGVVGFLLMYIGMFVFAFIAAAQLEYYDPEAAHMIATIVPMYVLMIIAMVLLYALQFLNYICIYKIYESTVPEKSLKYMLISLLVPLGMPICLMKCRNKGYSKEREYLGATPPMPGYVPPVPPMEYNQMEQTTPVQESVPMQDNVPMQDTTQAPTVQMPEEENSTTEE